MNAPNFSEVLEQIRRVDDDERWAAHIDQVSRLKGRIEQAALEIDALPRDMGWKQKIRLHLLNMEITDCMAKIIQLKREGDWE